MKLHSKKFKLIMSFIIVLTILFIFRNSLMNRENSAEESLKLFYLLKPIMELLLPDSMTTHAFLRKVAHFTEFGLLSFELCLFFIEDKLKDKIYKILFIGLFTAVLDETIQYFVGRGSMVTDCLIDFSGVLTILILFELIPPTLKLVMKKCKKRDRL